MSDRPLSAPPARIRLRHRAEDAVMGGLIGVLLWLPYRWRVPLMGAIAARVIAPLIGYRRRIRRNLAHICPDLPPADVERLVRKVPDNLGRALIEQFSGAEFMAHAAAQPIGGAGLEALLQAHAAGRPVVLATGHLGNHLAGIAALRARGLQPGGLYMPMTNPAVNRRYVRALSLFLDPAFPRGREGLARMLRFLRQGGTVGILTDQDMPHGAALDFMGKPARTALSAAEIALKHNALLVPGYALRQPDGLSFRIVIDPPIPHSDPVTMTQALNDNLAGHVRGHMDQWLWTHRRWKI
ncbi:lauroyl acyltransferase [Rhodobacteraceae bacterium 2376]|uniref:Lauroyl acyltransferase n=1 Tax=Rhabdonatronobacter sediminivivens TaxID=2743469 RepID=A0A7Z0I2D9_9RHOB|nr:lauroyl acyltransferase [Rhabdonatronobacter sediminivivens]NYS26264.1 lauroyl acyltransferase [Rhabdonatronobacter sediminivivens]